MLEVVVVIGVFIWVGLLIACSVVVWRAPSCTTKAGLQGEAFRFWQLVMVLAIRIVCWVAWQRCERKWMTSNPRVNQPETLTLKVHHFVLVLCWVTEEKATVLCRLPKLVLGQLSRWMSWLWRQRNSSGLWDNSSNRHSSLFPSPHS